MKICVLTYDAPHLKTSEVVMNILAKGEHSIDIMIFPFKSRPERSVAFNHRPFQFEGPDVRALAAHAKAKIWSYDNWPDLLDEYNYFLICGASLIAADFANSGKVVNCHPGILPVSRGLDAFKWAIYHNTKVGNSLHIIDSGIDSGEVFAHLETPLFMEDNISMFAARHYRREIFMLSNFDFFLNNGKLLDFQKSSEPPTKRMNASVEEEMLRMFESDFKTSL